MRSRSHRHPTTGGKDIYAAPRTTSEASCTLVECKKHVPQHRVGVELIRQLNGVVQAEDAYPPHSSILSAPLRRRLLERNGARSLRERNVIRIP